MAAFAPKARALDDVARTTEGEILGCDLAPLRLINCHLGNGCSLAAIQHGHSIDTTMGFTPLEGLMMGSRSGSVDPSILTYLQREKGYSADALDKILNKESGLKGISGISSDMRTIHKAIAEGNKRAQLALDIYIYRLRFFIGAMLATLRGVDVLTFTGGIGENDAVVRARTCEAFDFLNLKLDPEAIMLAPMRPLSCGGIYLDAGTRRRVRAYSRIFAFWAGVVFFPWSLRQNSLPADRNREGRRDGLRITTIAGRGRSPVMK